MRVAVHCTWALLLVLAAPAHAQQEPAPAGATRYTVFLNGIAAGVENVTVTTTATGTTIRSDGRFNPPLNITLRSSSIQYAADWTPASFAAEGSFNGLEAVIRTNFQNGTATVQGTEGGTPITETQAVSPKVIVLPNAVFAGYVALAKRLATDQPGVELRAYIPTQVEFPIRVTSVTNAQTQVGTQLFPVRRYDLIFAQPSGDLAVSLMATPQGDLVRLSVPSQSLEVIRSDVASPTSRTQVYSNPGDEAVIIPLVGFNLGATLTHPAGANATARLPAVILLGAANVNDRDGVMSGVPTLGQLAGALAEAGFLVVRYDKRGFGQSGGRSESATLTDQADDARAVAKWLSDRKDIDPRRIALVGHGEGAMVGLVAAQDRRIAAVVSIASPSTPGTEQFLEQQRLAVASSNLPQAERDKRLALQQQIQQAVLTGKGWEGIPAAVRHAADTPWFQSLLAYDPAKVLKEIRQPLLIVHGEVDRETPVAHAEKLAELARQQSKSKSVDLVIVRGVNHLLVPAVSGNTSEYGTLTDRNVSKDVLATVTDWLKKTLPAAAR